jgi:hypothetical protein
MAELSSWAMIINPENIIIAVMINFFIFSDLLL